MRGMAIMRQVLGHDGHGQDDGNVIPRFLGKNVAPVKLPEVGVSSTLHGRLHGARTGVVSSHGQVPTAKLSIKIFQVTGGGASRLLGILQLTQRSHLHLLR